MANKKPPIKNQILEDYLISSSHDVKSIGGLIVSGIISTFGVYSIIKPFFEEGSNSLNIALFSFIIVLIIFDTVKRGALTKFFNSLLKKKIINSKAKKGYLIIAVFATIFMVLLDGLGSWSTAEKGANLYTQFKTNSSTEYKILQQNAESGKAVASNYTLELKTWEESKKDAKTTCNEKWNGWKAKYKAKCKEEWNNAHPMPKQTTTGQIKIDDYKNIKNDQQSFLDEYLFIILFVLLSLMTLLMQYLTIAKIYDDYNEIEEGLTYERIQFINDTIQEHETIVAEHEQKTAEMMANSTREKKGQDRKFQEVGEAIAITHKKKMVDTRAETVKRIANNTYVPREESKAGMILNPFGDNETEKHFDKNRPWESKSIPTIFDSLYYIWNEGKAVKGDELNEYVPYEVKAQYLDYGGGLSERNGKFYADVDFDEAFKMHIINGTFHHSGGIRQYEQVTGRKFSEEEKKHLVDIWGTKDLSNLKKPLNEEQGERKIGFQTQSEKKTSSSFNLDSGKSRKELERHLKKEISKIYPSVDFVTVIANRYNQRQPEISVFFTDTPDGEAITFFSPKENDYFHPIHPILKERLPSVYKILYPFLKTEEEQRTPETLVTKLWDDGRVKSGEKLVSKTQIINTQDRSEDKRYKETMKKLTDNQVAKFKVGHGYYAVGGLDEALRAL